MVSDNCPRAHQHPHFAGRLAKKRRGLSRGIAAADNNHLVIAAQLRLHMRRAVIDALPLKLREVGDGRLVILRARGDDHRARRDLSPVIEHHFIRMGRAVGRVTPCATIIFELRIFSVCAIARAASSCPETPVGNPR